MKAITVAHEGAAPALQDIDETRAPSAGEVLVRVAKRDYAEVARHSVREMHRQVGDLVLGADGMARRGPIVRHLVMPGLLEATEAILRFVADELGLRRLDERSRSALARLAA